MRDRNGDGHISMEEMRAGMDGLSNNSTHGHGLSRSPGPALSSDLENLLVGPPPVEGGISIQSSINVSRLVDIDTRQKRFTVIFGVNMHWHDPRINGAPEELSQATINERAWRPDFFVVNMSEDPRVVDEHFHADRFTGRCLWYQRIRAVMDDDQFEMSDFPFDMNDLEVPSPRLPRSDKALLDHR